MTSRVLVAWAVLLGSGVASIPVTVSAHHSFAAEFDSNKPITLEGTLTKVAWMNPHGWIYVDVVGKDGKVTNWAVEFGSPNALLRRGLSKIGLSPRHESRAQRVSREERSPHRQRIDRDAAGRAESLHRLIEPRCAGRR